MTDEERAKRAREARAARPGGNFIAMTQAIAKHYQDKRDEQKGTTDGSR